MPVDIFSCVEFEKVLEMVTEELALPGFSTQDERFAWAKSIKMGEYTYWMPLDDSVALEIRSSISGGSGASAETGEDSIRMALVDWRAGLAKIQEAQYLGGKLSRYTTRVKGWEKRLSALISQLNVIRLLAGDCKCGAPLPIFKVKKEGPNKGRLFASCKACDTFKWIDTDE